MIPRRRDRADDLQMAGAEISIRLQPRARVDEVVGERDGAVVVRVTAPPHEGRANAALRRLIARAAGVGIRRVEIVRGAAGRQKVVRVEGMSAEQLRAALLRAP
jgi:uncharacterized protein